LSLLISLEELRRASPRAWLQVSPGWEGRWQSVQLVMQRDCARRMPPRAAKNDKSRRGVRTGSSGQSGLTSAGRGALERADGAEALRRHWIGKVTDSGVLAGDTFPAASSACTVRLYELPPVRPETVADVLPTDVAFCTPLAETW